MVVEGGGGPTQAAAAWHADFALLLIDGASESLATGRGEPAGRDSLGAALAGEEERLSAPLPDLAQRHAEDEACYSALSWSLRGSGGRSTR